MREWGNDKDKHDRWLQLEGQAWLVLLALAAVAVAVVWAIPALAHGGGLAADGCHMDRSAGVRHCHRGASAGAGEVPRRAAGRREVYYPNCATARAAGEAPVRVGQPGYGRHLDRDGDGLGCE